MTARASNSVHGKLRNFSLFSKEKLQFSDLLIVLQSSAGKVDPKRLEVLEFKTYLYFFIIHETQRTIP